MHDKILILDFGSQVTQLIARRVREAHVYCEIHPNDVSDDFIRSFAPKGIILSGSHASTYEDQDLRAPQAVWDAGVPVLGICYGMFAMTVQQGGQVEASSHREFGYAEVRAHGHTRLLKDIEDFSTPEGHGMLKVWMSHGDKVTALPPGFKLMASTPSCPIAGIADEARGYYGVQFHPEVTHTAKGRELLERFVLGICQVQADWVMRDHIADAVALIREQVGDEEVILGLSGGVDSSVAAALIHRAIGDQLTCVFVDHGLLRLNEGDMVMDMFVGQLHAKVIRVDASELFLGKLAGVSDPEAKRKIIGGEFVTVFKQEAAKLTSAGAKGAKWLAQGTIYPDVIESGGAKTKKATTIKSHHNVGGLPAELGLKLLEPLRDLFKDEVRELGVALGLPHEMVYRHPFPGPGLGVRILGEVKQEYADLLRRADAIFIEELRAARDEATGKNCVGGLIGRDVHRGEVGDLELAHLFHGHLAQPLGHGDLEALDALLAHGGRAEIAQASEILAADLALDAEVLLVLTDGADHVARSVAASPQPTRASLRRPSHRSSRARTRRWCSGACSSGSRSTIALASSCAVASSAWSRTRLATASSGRPLWRVPRNSPGPRISRSRSAITKPSLLSSITLSRSAASALCAKPVTRMQNDFAAPRPTRPRSWCSCERPKRSACSITITEALGTSTPTSTTVVDTSTSSSCSRKAVITWSFSSCFMRPCSRPTRASGKRALSCAAPWVASARSTFSLSSTSG